MAGTVTLLGRARLERKLRALPGVAKDKIRAELATQADIIVALAKSLVPVDSGDLRDSVGWTWGRAPKGSMVLAATKASLGSELTLTIYAGGNDAFYSFFVEFGTVKMAAAPFFYVSYRASRRGAKAGIRRAVRNAARSVAAG